MLSEGGIGVSPATLAASSNALARGCSLPICKPAAVAKRVFSSAELVSEIKESTLGLPIVRVPVLSKATIF